jgi:GNAT superfamily N-acetyltransferase
LWESRTPPDFFCNTSNTREPLTIRGQGFSAFGGHNETMATIGQLFADARTDGLGVVWGVVGDRSSDVAMPFARGSLDAVIRTTAAVELGLPISSPHGPVAPAVLQQDLSTMLDRARLPGARFSVRVTAEDDWSSVRAARIENATDNPVSYGATLETTVSMSEDDWRMRARRGHARDATSLVAVDDLSGRWIGMMGAQQHDDLVLTGVWVVPEFRGRGNGVAEVLLAETLAWTRGRADSIALWVDENPAGARARAFYERHGFTPTGRCRPIGFAPGDSVEMRRPLTPSSHSGDQHFAV